MIISLLSLTEASQNVAGAAIGALVILLVIVQFVDLEESRLQIIADALKVFTLPLFILFIFIIISRIVGAVANGAS